jgi:hypothetical protein
MLDWAPLQYYCCPPYLGWLSWGHDWGWHTLTMHGACRGWLSIYCLWHKGWLCMVASSRWGNLQQTNHSHLLTPHRNNRHPRKLHFTLTYISGPSIPQLLTQACRIHSRGPTVTQLVPTGFLPMGLHERHSLLGQHHEPDTFLGCLHTTRHVENRTELSIYLLRE